MQIKTKKLGSRSVLKGKNGGCRRGRKPKPPSQVRRHAVTCFMNEKEFNAVAEFKQLTKIKSTSKAARSAFLLATSLLSKLKDGSNHLIMVDADTGDEYTVTIQLP